MNRNTLLKGAATYAAATIILASYAAQNDSVTQAEKGEKNKPSIAETKAIAEEGFIYGLPIVMNYAVQYDFCVDKSSRRYTSAGPPLPQ